MYWLSKLRVLSSEFPSLLLGGRSFRAFPSDLAGRGLVAGLCGGVEMSAFSLSWLVARSNAAVSSEVCPLLRNSPTCS